MNKLEYLISFQYLILIISLLFAILGFPFSENQVGAITVWGIMLIATGMVYGATKI